uniref:Uncharacterized protein n=1 Tax=Anguilla anguilla TaxID=7936 RepID=A0A0E9XF67_ANGAN
MLSAHRDADIVVFLYSFKLFRGPDPIGKTDSIKIKIKKEITIKRFFKFTMLACTSA